MNRKKINKGLKFLSVAGAIMVFSATMVTAEKASAGFLTRLRAGFSSLWRGTGFRNGYNSARNTATGAQSASRLSSRLNSRPLSTEAVGDPGRHVLNRPILPNGDKGPFNPKRVKFHGGDPNGKSVVKLTSGNSGRTGLVSFLSEGHRWTSAGNGGAGGEENVNYASLNFKTSTGTRTGIKTTTSGGTETIYTKVKTTSSSSTGGAGGGEGNITYADLNLPKPRTRIKTTAGSGNNGPETIYTKVKGSGGNTPPPVPPKTYKSTSGGGRSDVNNLNDPKWRVTFEQSGDPSVGDLVVFKRTK